MKRILFIIILLVMCTGLKAPPSQNRCPYMPKFERSRLDLYIQSTQVIEVIIWAESRGNPKAYNKKEDAAGVLQIKPIMVREVCRILKMSRSPNIYTLKDRWDPVKSKEMFRIVMDYHNPSYDLRRSCLIWNGKGKDRMGNKKYYELVKLKFENNDNNKIQNKTGI